MKKFYGILISAAAVLVFVIGIYAQKTGWKPIGNNTYDVNVLEAKHCIPLGNICYVSVEGKQIGFTLPEDPVYLHPFPVEVILQGFNKQMVSEVSVDFYMPRMNMGINRADLESLVTSDGKEQKWRGEGLLPICVTGRKDWQAEVSVKTLESVYKARFFFEASSK